MQVSLISPDPHNRLLLLLLGLLIDAVFGDMPWLFAHVPHPVVVAGRAIAFLDRKLNRSNRSEVRRRDRGVLTVVLLVGAAAAVGAMLHWLCGFGFVGALGEGFLVGVLLAQRSLSEHVAMVGIALDHGGLIAGQRAVRHIVGRDPEQLDRHGVARAAIESLAENFSDGVVAPILWYLLLGLPGLFAYKMANTLDSMIGHRNPRYASFGWAAARLDDALNLIPAPLSGLLLAAAAMFSGAAHAGRACAVMLRDGRKHRSPNAGWPEAAMAGALDLALAGPRVYAEGPVPGAWLGDGNTPHATPFDIRRALQLYSVAGRLLAGLLFGAWAMWQLALPAPDRDDRGFAGGHAAVIMQDSVTTASTAPQRHLR
ncbi:MAG: cobalamin biosynthesis protein [Alphaproteobacteria bacterium]|nr:cobalamin biosynthesis protein [Alphaproteobacteria bacterium]